MLYRESEIGGATVKRIFRNGESSMRRGDNLTRAQVMTFPPNNRQSLIDNGFIAVYPPSPVDLDPSRLHVVSKGFGKYDVYEGRKVNVDPLTREQADALAPGSEPGEPAN